MGIYVEYHNLISRGQYDTVIETINKISHPPERLLLLKCEALIYKGQFEDAIPIIEKLSQSDTVVIKIDALRQQSLIHWSLGELLQSSGTINQAYNLLNELNKTNLDDLGVRAHVLHMCGTVCQNMGQLDDSLNYLLESLRISEKLDNKNRIAATLANLAIVYSYKGDQEKTLENYNNALKLLRELGKQDDEALVLGLLGETYWELGDQNRAIIFKVQSLDILRELKNNYRTADALQVLISFLVLHNRLDEAKMYYKELDEINNSTDAYNINFMTRFCEGLILKFSSRVKQKIIAQEIFEELLQEELDFEMRSEILLHLSDLLIDELRTYSEPEVLLELNKLNTQIYQMAKSQNNQYLAVEALILKAKMELINTNFTEADTLFENAGLLADKHGYDILKDKADHERKQLQDDLVSWQTLLSKGATIKERIDRSKIRDYLDKILSVHRAAFNDERYWNQPHFESDNGIIEKSK
jgi:tetratricopeptide (TPR) repeat protein